MKNKKLNYILIVLLASLSFSCDRSEKLDYDNSVIRDNLPKKTAFDNWLDLNYRQQYNIDFIYRLEDGESPMKYNIVPPEIEKSERLAQITKHVWFEAYDEVAGNGVHFTRQFSPRVILLIGSNAWNPDRTRTLGTAEGGIKVVLYSVNFMDEKNLSALNELFFHTFHHEFAHILHQTHNYPQEYGLLSAEDYAPTGWTNRTNINDYAPLGFVTAYAGSQPREDIAEVTSCYITYTDEQWEKIMAAAGEKGGELIEQKIKLVKKYMMEFFKIDMETLREVVKRRNGEIGLLPPLSLAATPHPASSYPRSPLLIKEAKCNSLFSTFSQKETMTQCPTAELNQTNGCSH